MPDEEEGFARIWKFCLQLLSLPAAIGTLAALLKWPLVYVIGAIGVTLLWRFLLYAWMAKRISVHDPTRKRHKFKEWQRVLALAGLISLSLLVAVVVYEKIKPPPPCRGTLPTDKFVVTIADLTPSASAYNEADDINFRLFDNLSNMQASGAPIDPYKASIKVGNIGNRDQQRSAAISFGNPPYRCAHAVLWGTISKDNENKLEVNVRLTIANEWQYPKQIERTIADYSPNLDFKNQTKDVAEAISNITAIVLGVAYYRVQGWDEAIKFFNTTNSIEGRLYKGLCYYQRAVRFQNAQDMTTAIQTDEHVIEDLPGAPLEAEEKNEFMAIAHSLLAGSYLSKGEFQNAINNYNTALTIAGVELYNRWAVENNLGVGLYEIARTPGDNQFIQHLQSAEKAYLSALSDCVGEESEGNRALVNNNLGSTLAYWGARSDGDQKRQLLEEASKRLQSAIEYYSREEKPSKQWAMAQTNYANVLVEKAKQMPEQANNNDLAKAVESYRAVLEVYDNRTEPQKHATVQHNLGTALFELAKRKQGEGGKTELQDAIAAFRTAIQMRESMGLSDLLANSKLGLAKALSEMRNHSVGSEQDAYLKEAISLFDELLRFYNQATYPQKHQELVNERATAEAALRPH
jgi:tetratricopeptide (TPR) repeat protein